MPYFGDQKREYQLNWMRNRREEYVEYLGGVCVSCGTKENLEFHHKVPEEKEFQIAQLLSRKRALVLKELEKCELRCVDCHTEVHAPSHGSSAMYQRRGCRCALCVEWNRVHCAMKYTPQKRHLYYQRTGK